jgi:hypothetical protein
MEVIQNYLVMVQVCKGVSIVQVRAGAETPFGASMRGLVYGSRLNEMESWTKNTEKFLTSVNV